MAGIRDVQIKLGKIYKGCWMCPSSAFCPLQNLSPFLPFGNMFSVGAAAFLQPFELSGSNDSNNGLVWLSTLEMVIPIMFGKAVDRSRIRNICQRKRTLSGGVQGNVQRKSRSGCWCKDPPFPTQSHTSQSLVLQGQPPPPQFGQPPKFKQPPPKDQ